MMFGLAAFSSLARDRLPVTRSCHDRSDSTIRRRGRAHDAAALLAGCLPVGSRCLPAYASRACRSCATPRSRRWCATMRGRSCKAAGLSKSGINIVLVNDRRFNAFVAGRRIFINTGALMTAETPNEIIGVIAHETGHHRRRPPAAAARPARARADHGDRRHAARRRRHGCRRGDRQQRHSRRPAWASPPAAAKWRGAACSAISAPRRRPPTARRSPISKHQASRPRAC